MKEESNHVSTLEVDDNLVPYINGSIYQCERNYMDDFIVGLKEDLNLLLDDIPQISKTWICELSHR